MALSHKLGRIPPPISYDSGSDPLLASFPATEAHNAFRGRKFEFCCATQCTSHGANRIPTLSRPSLSSSMSMQPARQYSCELAGVSILCQRIARCDSDLTECCMCPGAVCVQRIARCHSENITGHKLHQSDARRLHRHNLHRSNSKPLAFHHWEILTLPSPAAQIRLRLVGLKSNRVKKNGSKKEEAAVT